MSGSYRYALPEDVEDWFEVGFRLPSVIVDDLIALADDCDMDLPEFIRCCLVDLWLSAYE